MQANGLSNLGRCVQSFALWQCRQPKCSKYFRLTRCRSSNGASRAADLERAYTAVKLASLTCMHIQSELSAGSVLSKDDSSPVTVADFAAQAIVAWVLQQHNGGVRLQMVAEESADELREPAGKDMLNQITKVVQSVISKEYPGTIVGPEDVLELIDLGDSQGGPNGKHFILDPIDGTRGFVGLRQYAVCLGMIEDGVVELGVLGCPNMPAARMTSEQAGPLPRAGIPQEGVGVVFTAVRGEGAFCGPLMDGIPSTRLRIADNVKAEDAIMMESYDSRHSDHSVSAEIASALNITKKLQTDSQVKYGLLSRGDAHLFLRFPHSGYREKIWDHCAGVAIVEEAGGVVSDAAGQPLDFSKGRWLQQGGGIVAAPPTLHAQVIQAIKDRQLHTRP